MSTAEDQQANIPESSSYAEIPNESSSPAETAIGDPVTQHISSRSWRLSDGHETMNQVHEMGTGFDMAVSANSDTHPDVACNLIAEFLADTILRIDSSATVDLSVTMKQDLVLVTGEVGCSHPAKSAIIHSDQFLSTLNGSIREIFRDLGFDSGLPAPVATIQPAMQNSPLKKGVQASAGPTGTAAPSVSAKTDEPSGEDDGSFDPAQIHIIIAITDSVRETRSSGVVCTAKACEKDLAPVARKICNTVTEFLKSKKASLVGGVSADIIPANNGSVQRVGISFHAPHLTNELVKEMSETCVSTEFLKSLSGQIQDHTVIEIKHSGRNRATGRSAECTGKSWDDPRRYGAVLAKQAAVHLVKSGSCAKCEVVIRLGDSVGIDNDVSVMSLCVDAFGTSKEKDSDLIAKVLDRVCKRNLKEIQESVMKDSNSTLFSSGHGGLRFIEDSDVGSP